MVDEQKEMTPEERFEWNKKYDEYLENKRQEESSRKRFDPRTATDFECEMYDRARGIV